MFGAERRDPFNSGVSKSEVDGAGRVDRNSHAGSVRKLYVVKADDEQTLISLIQQGDHAAFETLFRTYYTKLFEFTCSYVRSSDIAEELVQDIFFDIWNRRRTWQLRTSLKAYLYSAARNKALDHIKHIRVVNRWASQHDAADVRVEGPDDTTCANELRTEMERAINELPDRRRQVFLLTRRHGLTYAQAAQVLGISVNTVEVQIGRALKYLRSRLSSFLCLMF